MTPRIRVRYGEGLDIPFARARGVEISDDRLLVTTPGRATTDLGDVGIVEAVRWLDSASSASLYTGRLERLVARINPIARALTGPHGEPPRLWSGTCVVVGPHGPLVAWHVADTSARADLRTTPAQLLAERGLAERLGATLETWTGELPDRSAIRLVTIRASRRIGTTVVVVSVLALVALLSSALGFRGLDGQLSWPFALVAVLLTVPLAVAGLADRAQALRLVRTPPAPEGRAVFHPEALETGDPRQLQLGREEVVVVPGDGSETWLPGPGLPGGVVEVQIGRSWITFHDADQGSVHRLGVRDWVRTPEDGQRLQRLFEDGGLQVEEMPALLRTDGGSAGPSGPSWDGPSVRAGDVSPVLAWLMWFLAPMTVVAGLGAMDGAPVVGWVAVVGGMVALALKIWCWWVWRRWLRAARRRGAI